MANQNDKLSAKQRFDIREFYWQGFEFLVRNNSQGKFINVKLSRVYNKRSKINDIYFFVEEHFYGKKRVKVKRVKISFTKLVRVYQDLKNIKLGSLLPSSDDFFKGSTIQLEIKRWNSKIVIEWIYKSQPRWKKLDNLIFHILGLCGEKRILKYSRVEII